MAFTEEDLRKMGYVPDGMGGFKRMKPSAIKRDIRAVKQGRPSNIESIIQNTKDIQPGRTIIILDFLSPGLNGSEGLIQEHHFKMAKRKERYKSIIQTLMLPKHSGKVKITYIRHTVKFMDWDNACASFKHLGDALVDAGVIQDDNPEILVEFVPRQIKSRLKDQHTEIIIEDLS